jgi:hypothetical protein
MVMPGRAGDDAPFAKWANYVRFGLGGLAGILLAVSCIAIEQRCCRWLLIAWHDPRFIETDFPCA